MKKLRNGIMFQSHLLKREQYGLGDIAYMIIEDFLKIWTCKEAIGKRLGCGFIKAKNIDSTTENCSTIIENGYIITVNI